MTHQKFPLNRLLEGRMLKIAELQDKIMVELASKFEIILHGGTGIWRVYEGKRFSFDIDVYYHNPAEILRYFKKTEIFNLVKKKITRSDVIYLKIHEGSIIIEVEISPPFKKISETDGEFYMVDGDSIFVNTLSPTDLLKEKISAFKNRRKARDLYDIFHLLEVPGIRSSVKDIKNLLPELKSEPDDFSGLRELILIGKPPDFETIKRRIRMHAKG